MNTIIYVENPKEKNHRLSLRLGEGFTMMESVKGTRHLAYPTTLTSVIHSLHTLSNSI